MADPIEYRVSLAERARHLITVEARFPTDGESLLDLHLPAWTPGSYLIREYARHVQDLTCVDEADRPLAVRKVDKATWRVGTEGVAEVRARYRVYAHEITVRTSHVDQTHAYWNGACVFLYTDRQRAPLSPQAARVVVDAPAGWRVATGLDSDGSGGFVAPDYDTLIDAPFEVGSHDRIEFEALGKPHVLALWGRPSTGFDRDRFRDDVKKIVETHAAQFHGIPYHHYTFLVHLVSGGYGGLEHRNSSTILASPFAFQTPNKYQDLLELISHEFFHLWNVKRIHPDALGPFDYQREAYTRSLWIVEGWTSYYDRLALRRAGLQPAKRYLEKLGEELTRLAAIPGRLRQSLEESSFDAWIKLYRPDENTVNSTVSYYLKGSIVALLLDLEIRRRTEGARSLDDALRALWSEFGQLGQGYPDDAIQPLVERATGLSLDDFFAHAVRGRDELDLHGPLGSVGLRVKRADENKDKDKDKDKPAAWLGAHFAQEGDRLRVTESLEDGPAQASGISPGDQVLACDGFRVDKESLVERIAAHRPGDALRFTLFRRDELCEVTVALGRRPHEKMVVEFVEDAPIAARSAYRAWLGEEWGA